MNRKLLNSNNRWSLLARTCFLAGFSASVIPVSAAPGELFERPLSFVTSTKPNVLLLLDDSGSMDLNAVVTNAAQEEHGNVNVDNNDSSVQRTAIESDLELRALCAAYNALAFNPEVKYEKWQDYPGTTFPADQHLDMTSVADNPFPGLGSITTSDLTDHIYIRWNDKNNNGSYDYILTSEATATTDEIGNSECGSVGDYDSAAAASIAIPVSGVIEPDENRRTEGVFTDSNSNGFSNGFYSVGDSGALVINITGGGKADSGDFITFTVTEFNVDTSSGDSDSLTVYGGLDIANPTANAITVTEQFDFAGGAKLVSTPTYSLPSQNGGVRVRNTVSSILSLDDANAQNRNDEIRQFTVNGSEATLVFDGGSNGDTRSGFIISWRHSSVVGGPPGDGILTKSDCVDDDNSLILNCVRVDSLPLTAATALPGEENNTQENYANWYTYYRNRISVAKKALSDVVYDSNYRVGLATLNDNGFGGALIENMENEADGSISADKANLLEKIYATRTVKDKPSSFNGTRLIAGLSNAGRYFKENIDPENDFFGTNGAAPYSEIATTHEEDGDNDTSNDTTVDNSPIFNNAYGGECQQNFTLAFTDGAWTDDVSDYLSTASGDNAKPGHDINASGAGFVGDQDTTGVYAGGAYADIPDVGGLGVLDTLADVSMYYFAEDLAPSVTDSLNVQLHDQTISHQHMVTFAVGFGVSGEVSDDNEPTDYSTTHNLWPRPVASVSQKIDDLRHAAFNGRGSYVSASDPEKLTTELDNIITEIGVRVTNTASGASFSSFDLTDGAFRFSTTYDATNWTGDLEGFAFNGSSILFNETPEWSADTIMSTRSDRHTDRKIITYNGSEGIPFRFSFGGGGDYRNAGDPDTLSPAQTADLLTLAPHTTAPVPSTATATVIPSTVDGPQIARNQAYGEVLVNYLRGDNSYDGITLNNTFVSNGTKANSGTEFNSAFDSSRLHSFRERDGHYIGSLVHSQPEFVGAPNNRYPDDIEASSYLDFVNDDNYKNRREMIYVGSNGGMLHGFYARDESEDNQDAGTEVFAYVPSIVSDASKGGKGLHRLALETYNGEAYVDGSPNVSDVFVSKENGEDPDPRWRSYLVGGLRAGGRGIYVLDVTNPDSGSDEIQAPELIDAENEAARIVVSEFTHDELGYVYSRPLISKMNNGRWAAILGNGYNSSDSGDGTASLFIVYLDASTEAITDPNDADADADGNGILNHGYGDYSIITATTAATTAWSHCADDGETCSLPENAQVRYGSNGSYTAATNMLKGAEFTCDATLGDPGAAAVNPVCEYSDNNGLSQPEIVDLNGDGITDRVYAGDLHGNMWIFDVSDSDTSAWGLHNTDNAPFFTACAADLEENGFCHYDSRQPITAQPLIRNNPIQTGDINKLVFFGTGQYLTAEDRASNIKQSFYTVWDVNNVTHSLDKSNLQAQVIDNPFDTGNSSDFETRVIRSTSVNYSTSSSEYGWYYEALPGLDGPIAERVILTPLLFSGVLVFQTLVPNEGLCNASAGNGFIMAVNPLTGGNPPIDIFRIDGVPNAAGILVNGFMFGGSFTQDGGDGNNGGVKFNADTADGVSLPIDFSSSGSGGVGGVPGSLFPESGRKAWTITQ